MGVFDGFMDFMARLGLSMRDDPVRVIDLAARTWGTTVDWAAVSIELIEQSDSEALPSVSAVLRNSGKVPVDLVVPGWLFFFSATVVGPDGPVDLGPFGEQLLRPERRTERIEVHLQPGTGTEARIPIGQLFGLRAVASRRERYRVSVTCELPGGALVRSNEISV